MRRITEQIIEGRWTRWNRKDRWICCDCSMVHEIEFRIESDEHISVRMKVDRRSTSQLRRYAGIKVIKEDGTGRNSSGS